MDTVFIYDVELPASVIPVANPEEVADYILYSADTLYNVVDKTEEMKYNSALVMIDFFIRHGILTADHNDYLEIIHRLRRVPF